MNNLFKSAAAILFASAFSQSLFSQATLKVILGDSIRPVTHCASGSLYGMTETLPSDIPGLVEPLKCNMFCLPPEGGSNNQHAFGDGFIVAERLKSAGSNAKIQITFPDLLPYWPYKWPGQQSWLNSVEGYLKKKVNEGYDNIDSYVIWNEPDGTWKTENGELTTTVWKPTFDLIRRIDPGTKIVGPCIAYYHHDRMYNFLKFCKENNCLPDLICWHQWGSAGFVGAVRDVRKIMSDLGISDRPFCINEYCAGSDAANQKFEGCPGYSVPFIAKFERNNVESATISWWFTGLPGRLGSLLTAQNEKGGGWWLYKWYGDMAGYMANVIPPKDDSDGVDGFAAVDKKHNQVSLVLGGNTVGNVNVEFSKMPDFLGENVRVKVERVVWEDKDKAVHGTDLVSETNMAVNGSALTVPVQVESKLYGYRVLITPVNVPQIPFEGKAATIPGRVEAENYDVAGPGFSFVDRDDENKGGEYRDDAVDIVTGGTGYAIGYTQKEEWLEYTVNVQTSAEYKISASTSGGGDTDGFNIYIDGKLVNEPYTLSKTGEDWSIYKTTDIATTHIEKGEHIIKIEIVGEYVNIDYLDFEEVKNSSLDVIGSNADADYIFYDANGKEVNASNLEKDKVYTKVSKKTNVATKFIAK